MNGVRVLILSQINPFQKLTSKNTTVVVVESSSGSKSNADPEKEEEQMHSVTLPPSGATNKNNHKKKTSRKKISQKRTTISKKKKNDDNEGKQPTKIETKIEPTKTTKLAASILTPKISTTTSSSKKTKSEARRNIPLHLQKLWMPENFASQGERFEKLKKVEISVF